MPTILETLSIAQCVVSYGKEASFAGSLANVAITVTPKALGVNQLRLVWAATGDIFSSFTDSTVGGSGTPGIIVLPQTGQDGFRHGTSTFKDWYYEAVVTATTADGQQLSRTYRFQIPAGTTTLDLDMLDEDGIVTAMPAVAPVPTVTSVNGQTGDVTVTAGGDSDADIAAIVATPTSATAAALAATYAPIDGILSQERSHLLGVQAAEQRNLAPGCTIGAWSAPNAASSIANPVDVDAILDPFGAGTVNPIFRYYGGHPTQRSSTAYPGQVVTKMTGLTADATELMPAIVFNHEGATTFEIRIFGQGSYQTRTRVAVDGAWINYTLLDGPAQDGNIYRRTITLPDSSKHEIRVEFSGFSAWFAGITIGPAATVTRVLRNSGPRLIMVGDSETEGANGLANVLGNKLGFAPEAARLVGVEDFWQSAIGDTGYIGTSGGTRPTVGQRLQADVIDQTPDWVHFTAGQVDGGLGTPPAYDQMFAAVGDVLDRTRAGLPGAQITVQSPWRPFTGITAVASTIVVRNAIRDACTARGIPFYDVSQFITGTGRIGATTGDGNADSYIGPDGVHLSDAGHIAAGRYLAAMLRRTLSLPGVAG